MSLHLMVHAFSTYIHPKFSKPNCIRRENGNTSAASALLSMVAMCACVALTWKAEMLLLPVQIVAKQNVCTTIECTWQMQMQMWTIFHWHHHLNGWILLLSKWWSKSAPQLDHIRCIRLSPVLLWTRRQSYIL